MAGFYTAPFQKIAPKTAESSKESNTPLDSFMDVAKCLRAMIFNFMRKQPESCEVFKKGENEELDKQLDDYLTYRKNKTRNKVHKSNVFVLYFFSTEVFIFAIHSSICRVFFLNKIGLPKGKLCGMLLNRMLGDVITDRTEETS